MGGHFHSPRAGFSLVEATVLIVVVAIAVPPMAVLLRETLARSAESDMQTIATALARGLLEEILSKEFEDAQAGSGSFGTEEVARADFDDVDDYDGLNQKPPQDSRGQVLTDYSAFRTKLTVKNVAGDAPGGPAEPDGSTDFKRVEVTVLWNADQKYVRLIGLRSSFGAGADGQAGMTFIERRNASSDDLKFRVRNDSGKTLYVTHLALTWSSPSAYYEEIKLNARGYSNYGKVWDEDEHNDVRMGSGDTAMFNQGKLVLVPAGTTMEIEVKDFRRNRKGGGPGRDIEDVQFTVEIWAGADQFTPFTVPPE